jgi:hypothetical protein
MAVPSRGVRRHSGWPGQAGMAQAYFERKILLKSFNRKYSILT